MKLGIRDEELKRLEAYAKSIGIQVLYKKKDNSHDNGALFYIDGSKIIVYTWPRLSKTQIVLNLIHELAHALHWIDTDKKTHPDLVEALLREGKREAGETLDVFDRKLIYEDEEVATLYWDKIVKHVDIKINPSVILLQKYLDLFNYEFYYKTGEFPTPQQFKEKKKELKDAIKAEQK